MKKAERKIVKNWARRQKRANRREIAGLTLLGLLNVGAGIGQAYGLARFLAVLLVPGPPPQMRFVLLKLLLVFAVFSLSRILLAGIQEFAALRAGQRARKRLRFDILAKISAFGPVLLRHHHSAIITEILIDRVEALEGYFSRFLPAASLWIMAQWSIVLVVFWQNRQAGLILGACCLALPFFQAIFGIATALASRKQFLAMSRLQSRFLDRVKGIATLLLSGDINSEIDDLQKSTEELRKRTMRVLRIAFMASATTDIAMIIALIGVVISQVHFLHQNRSSELTAQAIFAVLMVPEAFAPFRALAAAYQDRAQGQATAEALEKLSLPPAILTGSSAPHESDPAEDTGAGKTANRHGSDILVEDLTYYWAEDRPPALSHISFHLKAGEAMLLEGASGAGKSTLMELMLGFVPVQQGRICFGGREINSLSPAEHAGLISWIGQKPLLFAGTLRENVLFAKPDASEDSLNAALEAAHVTEYLSKLPDGDQTLIGEGGFGLSGGQAQRIAIARAWLKDAPLLFLDEPTAHLDPETEETIIHALKKLLRGRTALIATHSAQYEKLGDFRKLHLAKGHMVSETAQTAKAGSMI